MQLSWIIACEHGHRHISVQPHVAFYTNLHKRNDLNIITQLHTHAGVRYNFTECTGAGKSKFISKCKFYTAFYSERLRDHNFTYSQLWSHQRSVIMIILPMKKVKKWDVAHLIGVPNVNLNNLDFSSVLTSMCPHSLYRYETSNSPHRIDELRSDIFYSPTDWNNQKREQNPQRKVEHFRAEIETNGQSLQPNCADSASKYQNCDRFISCCDHYEMKYSIKWPKGRRATSAV